MEPITATTDSDMATTEARLRETLADNGFGILTEIDLAGTLKAKIDVDRAPLKILGACNPHLANQALDADPSTALMLPCNVVLEGTEAGTTVSTIDPHDLIDNPDLASFADEAASKLRAAITAL